MSTRPCQRSRPSCQNTTSAKVRWMSMPITRRIRSLQLLAKGAVGCTTTTDPCSRRNRYQREPRSSSNTRFMLPVTNLLERRFAEFVDAPRPMGTSRAAPSMERILLPVFIHENRNQGLATPFALTQTF